MSTLKSLIPDPSTEDGKIMRRVLIITATAGLISPATLALGGAWMAVAHALMWMAIACVLGVTGFQLGQFAGQDATNTRWNKHLAEVTDQLKVEFESTRQEVRRGEAARP